MPFEGDLRSVSLESVLRNIDANSLTGILTIRCIQQLERQIAFHEGRIVAFRAPRGEERGVPRALQKKGIMSADQVEKVRSSLAWKRMNLRRALEYRGLVKEQDYTQAVRDEVIVPHILELFLHPERTFRFVETPLESLPTEERALWDPDQLAAELRIPIGPLVLEAVKRLDEKKTSTARYGRASQSSEDLRSDMGPISDVGSIETKKE